MSINTQVAAELLDEIDSKVKTIEDTKLSWWSRFKRRYWNWRSVIVWNVSGNFTLFQIFAGKKIWAWFTATFPPIASFLGKVWGGICSAAIAVYEVVVP
jgi:hypothetical protein